MLIIIVYGSVRRFTIQLKMNKTIKEILEDFKEQFGKYQYRFKYFHESTVISHPNIYYAFVLLNNDETVQIEEIKEIKMKEFFKALDIEYEMIGYLVVIEDMDKFARVTIYKRF